MIHKIKACCLITTLLLLSSCSWQEYFILENDSNSNIIVSYTISQVDGFPIFDGTSEAYMATNSGEIDWNKKISIEDKDTSALGLQFTLPPNSILIIGHLSNDKYSKYDQYFINSRVFNIQTIEIKRKDGITIITKEKFDTFFKKKNGAIKYKVH